MTLEVRNIYPLTPTFKKVASLYEAAFPVEERLPLWQLSWNSLKRGQSFLAYFDQGVFIGFTYVICTDNLVYLLFLAVEESKQSQGYGSQILAQVKKEARVRPCVLTIEPMDEKDASNRNQRLKRLAFYERNGYQLLKHFYFEGTERYQILTTDKRLSLVDLERALAKTFLGKHGVRVE
ncbi:MAG: GNAT family N-acetyltransferase [Streptococcus salivarius]|nr:GNAT family N-acetyltransferase [Streptococcus salivarius]